MKTNYEGKKYIIRGDKSGVFFGEVEERNGQEVKMKNCRRIWYWDGANSISDLATRGTQQPENCKFTKAVENIEILDVIEVIECTDIAIKSIEGVREWKY